MAVIEYLADDQLRVAEVTARDARRLTARDPRGRTVRVNPEKVLFEHAAARAEEVARQAERLREEVDVPLLWEAAREETPGPRAAAELAKIYFDDGAGPLQASAVYRALVADRVHFRRRGRTFEPRAPDELAQVIGQREREAAAAAEVTALAGALGRGGPPPDSDLCHRLERWLRGEGDRPLEAALAQVAKEPAEHAFELLLRAGHLPPSADLEVLRADIRRRHPAAVTAHASALPAPEPPAGAPLVEAAFAIDDPETREVDDALDAAREGDLIRVTIDIADAAAWVLPGDPVDREARRRAATSYLPTGVAYMLPEAISCERATLATGAPRRAMRTTIWVDPQGEIVRHALSRVWVTVRERLDYERADALLGGAEPGWAAETLAVLAEAARRLAGWRRAHGAFAFQRQEWKIRVSEDASDITVKALPPTSPSRSLVSEMMVAAGATAARVAREAGIPFIYRVQGAPEGKLPEVDPADPAAFVHLRNVISSASLSLTPGPHWALGLPAYAQATSPLRRYGDLVQQRQLAALVAGEPPPYDADAMLAVLGAVEATEQTLRRVETAVTQRWAMEYLARLPRETVHRARITGEVGRGYKAEVLTCGAQGVLREASGLALGGVVEVTVEAVRPRRGQLRLRLA